MDLNYKEYYYYITPACQDFFTILMFRIANEPFAIVYYGHKVF